jgi:xanthine dehydrogenase molybdenum-binding subunit
VVDELSVVGKNFPRKDASEKVTGRAKYTADISLPGMLYGKILRSPHAHANILSIDTTMAEAMPGVEAVVTHKDVVHKVSFRDESEFYDMYILDDKVRYVGDEVAGVAAVSEVVAEEALELIQLEYEVLPAVFTAEEAIMPNAPQIHKGGNQATPLPGMPFTTSGQFGDVEKGFAEADLVLERTFRTHMQSHAPLEPWAIVADWDSTGKLTLWNSTQRTFGIRGQLAHALGLLLGKVRVIAPYVGGGFGCKLAPFKAHGIAALLAKKASRPVKIEFSREEQTVAGHRRYNWFYHLKVGAKRDGSLTAFQVKALVDTGAYVFDGVVACHNMVEKVPKYRIPNRKYEALAVRTNRPPGSPFRGFASLSPEFCIGTLMDELAEKLEIDPLTFHLKNHIRSGEPFGMRNVSRSLGLEESIPKGADRIGWRNKWHRPGERVLPNGKKHGIGMGIGGGSFAASFNSGAIVKLNEDGSADLLSGSVEIGQGVQTEMAQICAESLGVRYEDVNVISSDTDITPYDFATVGSRTTVMHGNAVKLAAEDARRQLLDGTAPLLEVNPEELEAREGWVYVKTEPGKRISIAEIARSFIEGSAPYVLPKGVIIGRGSFAVLTMPPPVTDCVVNFAEVEIDTETGHVGLLRLVTVVDCGKAVNPKEVEGQAEAVLSAGLGNALMEEILLDQETGRVLNPTFQDYKIPTALDYSELDPPIIVEVREPLGPFGAKGVGEATITACSHTISNAVYNAIGARISLPITPQKVLQALGKK